MLRNTYAVKLTAETCTGVIGTGLAGTSVSIDMDVTLDEQTATTLSGKGRVSGRVTGVTSPWWTGLPDDLVKKAGKGGLAFSGELVLSGASQVIQVTWPDARLSMTLMTRPGLADFSVTGVVTVTSALYAALVGSAEFKGDAVRTGSVVVPDTDTVPVSDWVPRAPSDLVIGYMGSDLLADTGLASRRHDLLRLRSAFTHLLVTADLQVPNPGDAGSGWMRPYVGHTRTPTSLTELGFSNIALLHSLGFKLHLILFNTWALKHGYSANLGSIGRPGVSEDRFAAAQLPIEREFVRSLLADPRTAGLAGLMPCLEAASADSGKFCVDVAREIKEAGYAGLVTANVIGSAGGVSAQLRSMGVLLAPSQPTPAAWAATSADIRNSDGMQGPSPDAEDVIRKLVASPGPRGYYLWVRNSVGSNAGRSHWPDGMIMAAGGRKSSSGSGGGGGSAPPPANESAEARCKRLYPGVSFGGGNKDSKGVALPVSNTSIWKPKSDSNGRLVIVAGHNLPRILRVVISKGAAVLATLTTIRSIGNGWRCNFDGSKSGASYGTGLTVTFVTDNGEYKMSVPNGGSRVEVSLKVPTTPAAPPVTPPVEPPVTPPPVDPDDTGGALFLTTANSLTLRADFAAVVTRVDAVATVMDPNGPGNPPLSVVVIYATRSGNTWTIPQPLASYRAGNVPNTWRIRLSGKPPAPATYHTSIMQSFVRVGDNPLGPGNRTYPKTTRP